MKSQIKIFILICCVFLTMTMSAYAGVNKDVTMKNISSITMSEKDIIVELQKKDKKELEQEGYSLELIDEIKNFSEVKVIKELQELSDSALLERGYTTKEITQLRSMKSATDNPSIVYGKVTYSIEKVSYTYNKTTKRTILQTKAKWQWSKAPIILGEDVLATSTSNPAFTADNNSRKASIYYSDTVNGTKTIENISAKSFASGTGGYVQFPLKKTINGEKKYAFSGNIIMTYEADGKISQVVGVCKYGHFELSISADLSVELDGIEITFKPEGKWKSNGEATATFKLV